MADYAIGDVQGCYDALMRLLDTIDFDEKTDCLWFVGDLVNRGPESLKVLRFINTLPVTPKITLGNHDLHLVARIFADNYRANTDDTLKEVLNAEDAIELGHWLRRQSILIYEAKLNIVMCHAGIAPAWDLQQAKQCAEELETVLRGEHFRDFLNQMYGNEPNCWSDSLKGIERLRVITNYFTRMRYCDGRGGLDFTYKGTLANVPKHLMPWFEVPLRKPIAADIIFGHWAALQGQCAHENIFAIDLGCLWGGRLAALKLQDRKMTCVECDPSKKII